MADDVATANPKPAADEPLAAQGSLNETGVAAQAGLDPPREVPAAERLRAFEDEHFGKDAVRIGGQIERGSGSLFAGLTAAQKRQYAALEKLVGIEQELADALSAVVQAEAKHEAALAAAEPTE